MRNGLRFFGLAAVAALSLTALAIQDAVVLKHVNKVGDTTKLRMTADMEVQGQPVTFSGLMTDKVTKVGDNGDYTVESTMTDLKVNDQDVPAQDATDTTTFSKSGQVLTVSTTQGDPNYRMANFTSIQFPDKSLKVGDSWTAEFKKNDKGAVDGKGTYTVDGREMVGKHDTFKVHAVLKETTDQDPSSFDGTLWIDVKDGSLVKGNATWKNAPLPQIGPLDMKMTLTREE